MLNITLKGNPISTNNCYFHLKPGMRILSSKAKALKEDYMWQAKSQYKNKPLIEELEIDIKIYFGTKRKYDWDNFHKLSMDSLTGIIWEDDSQIQKATVEKFYDKENPRIDLCINPLHNKN
jgi:Holliday junction resolvase RusA-like endonuclease